MAISFWWLGHATVNSAKVCVRGTTTGAVSVSCNGATFTSAIDTAVNDGVAVVNVTGLAPFTQYPITISDASGATERGAIKTMPSAGGKVAFISCDERVRSLSDLAQNIIFTGAQAVCHEGDYIYAAANLTNYNGETSALINTSSTAANYAVHWRQCKRKHDKRLLETTVPHYYMFDDHEFGGDNWDHSVYQAQQTLNVASGDTDTGGLHQNGSAQVDASWWAARQAAGYYMVGNPDVDAGLSPDKPPGAQAGTPSTQYPVCYYRFTCGDIEVFHIDCFSYRSFNAATDNASKTMLGATQKAWLKARLSASAATFKVIASGKTTYKATAGGTGDDWTIFGTERDELIAYIQNNGITGCVWMCGDAHGAFVTYDPSRGHIAVCANPAGVDHIVQATGHQPYTVWKESAYTPNGTTDPRKAGLFGLCEVVTAANGTKALLLRLIDQYGAELWRGWVDAGTNVLRTA